MHERFQEVTTLDLAKKWRAWEAEGCSQGRKPICSRLTLSVGRGAVLILKGHTVGGPGRSVLGWQQGADCLTDQGGSQASPLQVLEGPGAAEDGAPGDPLSPEGETQARKELHHAT